MDLDTIFTRIERLAAGAGLPGLERGTSYGTPALKVGGRSFCRLKDAGTLVLLCPMEAKELLMERDPAVYYETDHYRGWPAVLVRLEAIGDDELALRLTESWRTKAPKRLAKAFEGG